MSMKHMKEYREDHDDEDKGCEITKKEIEAMYNQLDT